MRLLVLGSTGVVGAEVIREALQDERIARVVAVSRRPLPQRHARLEPLLHDDFTDFSPVQSALTAIDAGVCALGMAWPQATDEAHYRRVTRDFVLAAARTLQAASPEARCCFVSGHGASAGSRQTWARIKAETETALAAMFGSRLTVFRPAYIYPVHGRDAPYWGDAIMRPFMPFRSLMARFITDSVTVARALLYAANGGVVRSPAANDEIARAAAAYSGRR